MINITHKIIWKSVDMKKRNQRKAKDTSKKKSYS